MFSAVDGFRYSSINVANGYISTFNSNTSLFTGIPSSDGSTLYLGGNTNPSGSDTSILWMSINNNRSARIATEKALGNTSSSDRGLLMDIDSGANVYVVGVQASNIGEVAKYASGGSLTWQKQVTSNVSGGTILFTDVAVESGGGNLYAGGTTTILDGSTLLGVDYLVKFNSSGTVLSQNRFGWFHDSSYYTQNLRDLSVDSSNNVYLTGYIPQSFDGNTTYHVGGTVQKRNSSNTLQWSNGLYSTTSNTTFEQSVIDSSGNVFVCGSANGPTSIGLVAKFYSNGALGWQKTISNAEIDCMTLDNTGNIYLAGRNSANLATTWFSSLDQSTGNINWQNFLHSSSGNIIINDINYANSFLYGAGGFQGSGGLPISFKLASNGNVTGTHGVYTFSSGNFTASTSTLSTGGDTFTFTSTSYSNSSSNLSSFNGSVSRSITPL